MAAAPALRNPEETSLRIVDLHLHAAPARLVDDQPGIGVENVVGFQRARIEPFVDGVLALDRKGIDAAEMELLVERDRLNVVVDDRQVHEGGAPGLEMPR